MKKIKYFFLLVFFLFLSIICHSLFNNELYYSKNTSFIDEYIKSHLPSIMSNSTYINETIFYLIETANFKILESFLIELNKQKIEFKSMLNTLIQNKVNTIQKVYNNLSLIDSSTFLVVSPAFLWGEDTYNVNLHVLFSHRHNAPGCSEIDDHFAVIYNNNYSFHFNANCTLGDDELYFNLDLTFYDKISKIESIDIQRGKAKIRLSKDKKYEWGKLLRPGEEIPNNMLRFY